MRFSLILLFSPLSLSISLSLLLSILLRTFRSIDQSLLRHITSCTYAYAYTHTHTHTHKCTHTHTRLYNPFFLYGCLTPLPLSLPLSLCLCLLFSHSICCAMYHILTIIFVIDIIISLLLDVVSLVSCRVESKSWQRR